MCWGEGGGYQQGHAPPLDLEPIKSIWGYGIANFNLRAPLLGMKEQVLAEWAREGAVDALFKRGDEIDPGNYGGIYSYGVGTHWG